MKLRALSLLGISTLAIVAIEPAMASCRIRNETKYSFTVESGNTSNQSVGAHTTTTIAAGKIIAKNKDGKSFGGSCRDGDELKVVEEKGVVILMPK